MTLAGRQVWVAGRMYDGGWEVLGIMSTEQFAVELCKTMFDFVAPMQIDVPAPEEMTDWPGCYYPMVQE